MITGSIPALYCRVVSLNKKIWSRLSFSAAEVYEVLANRKQKKKLGITVLVNLHSILGRLVEFPLAFLMVMISRHDFLSSSRCGYPVAKVRFLPQYCKPTNTPIMWPFLSPFNRCFISWLFVPLSNKWHGERHIGRKKFTTDRSKLGRRTRLLLVDVG